MWGNFFGNLFGRRLQHLPSSNPLIPDQAGAGAAALPFDFSGLGSDGGNAFEGAGAGPAASPGMGAGAGNAAGDIHQQVADNGGRLPIGKGLLNAGGYTDPEMPIGRGVDTSRINPMANAPDVNLQPGKPDGTTVISENPAEEARKRRVYGEYQPRLSYSDPDKQRELDYVEQNSKGSKWKQFGKGALSGLITGAATGDFGGALGGALAGGVFGAVNPEGMNETTYQRYVLPQFEHRRQMEYARQKQQMDMMKEELGMRKTVSDIGHSRNQDEVSKRTLEENERYHRQLGDQASATAADREKQRRLEANKPEDVGGWAYRRNADTGELEPILVDGQKVRSKDYIAHEMTQQGLNERFTKRSQQRADEFNKRQAQNEDHFNRGEANKNKRFDQGYAPDAGAAIKEFEDAKAAAAKSGRGLNDLRLKAAVAAIKQVPGVSMKPGQDGWPYLEDAGAAAGGQVDQAGQGASPGVKHIRKADFLRIVNNEWGGDEQKARNAIKGRFIVVE